MSSELDGPAHTGAPVAEQAAGLEPQLGGGVVGPCVVDADVAAERGKGAVTGVVGDGSGSRSAEWA